MFIGSFEQKKENIKKQIEALRTASKQIGKIKKVVQEFDGKIYNCRFDKAISELSDKEAGLRFYTQDYYTTFAIQCSTSHFYSPVTLLETYRPVKGQTQDKCICFDENKRIKADKMIELLNNKYSEILKKAQELENALNTIETTLDQLEQIKNTYKLVADALPYQIRDVFGIKYVY
jgi:uncharacterized protein YukE